MTSLGEQMATEIHTRTKMACTTGTTRVMPTPATPAVVTDAPCVVVMGTSTREEPLDIMVTDSRLDSELATLMLISVPNQGPPTTSTDMELVDATLRDGPMDMEADTVKDMERDMDLLTDGLNTMDTERATQAPRDQ